MKCTKRKFSKFEAMLFLAQASMNRKRRKGKSRRKECRYYYCKQCNAYHLTSKERKFNG